MQDTPTLVVPRVQADVQAIAPLRPYDPDQDLRIAAGAIMAIAALVFVVGAIYFTIHPVIVPGL